MKYYKYKIKKNDQEITVITNDPVRISTAPGDLKELEELTKAQLDKLSKTKNVEVHTVK